MNLRICSFMKNSKRQRKVLAVSSGGGHWVQLLRLRPAFTGCEVTYVTVKDFYKNQVVGHRFYVVNDATRWNKIGLIILASRVAWIILKTRPDAVISTGAAPGYFALFFGRLIGCKTIWLDSIANVDRLSMSGRLVRPHADLWLTQWPHLSTNDGPLFFGSVL